MTSGNKIPFLTPSSESRFQSFVLFEPSSLRMNDVDILMRGEKVKEMYDYVIDHVQKDTSIKSQILRNKLTKIGQMIDLLSSYDQVIMSKFFDRIWRRYSYVSNIGEHFLDLPTFLTFFPEYAGNTTSLLAQRIDDEDEDDIDSVARGEEPVSTISVDDLSEEEQLIQ